MERESLFSQRRSLAEENVFPLEGLDGIVVEPNVFTCHRRQHEKIFVICRFMCHGIPRLFIRSWYNPSVYTEF